MLILLVGNAGSGKSTVADHLYNEYYYDIYSLGDAVKKTIVELSRLFCPEHPITLPDLYNPETKNQYRELMQQFATDIVRNRFGQDIWTNTLIKEIEDDQSKYIVIDDVRFPNEVECLRKWYADKGKTIIIRINNRRFADDKIYEHISETANTDIKADYTIDNHGTYDELFEQVDFIMHKEQDE